MNQAPPYQIFSHLYDRCMEHVPYSVWADYLIDYAAEHPFPAIGKFSLPDHVLDLGCGTASLLKYFIHRVRHITGMDGEPMMLKKAKDHFPTITFVQGKLEGPFPFKDNSTPWIISTHDSLNYLTDPAMLMSHFKEVRRVLTEGGLYSFDMVTENNILENFDGTSRTFRSRPYRLQWDNEYDREERLLTSSLSFFRKDEFLATEIHKQRFYSDSDVTQAVKESGFELLSRNGDYRFRNPSWKDTLINYHIGYRSV